MVESLGLEEPRYIIGAKFSEKELALHIYFGIRKAAMVACPKCGVQTKRNGYESSERVWWHSNVMLNPYLVRCSRAKVLCSHCGNTQ